MMRLSSDITLVCLLAFIALACGQRERGSGVKIGQGAPRDVSSGGRGTGVRIGSNTGRGLYSKTVYVTTQGPAPAQIRPPTDNGGEGYGNGGRNGNGPSRHDSNGNGNENGKSLYSGNDDTTEAGYIVPQVSYGSKYISILYKFRWRNIFVILLHFTKC